MQFLLSILHGVCWRDFECQSFECYQIPLANVNVEDVQPTLQTTKVYDHLISTKINFDRYTLMIHCQS